MNSQIKFSFFSLCRYLNKNIKHIIYIYMEKFKYINSSYILINCFEPLIFGINVYAVTVYSVIKIYN